MAVMRFRDIDPKQLRKAQGFLAAMSILGISEEDLLLLKEIPSMKEELAELRQFRADVLRQLAASSDPAKPKTAREQIAEAFGQRVEEFTPYGKRAE